jgi:hypothetical protein
MSGCYTLWVELLGNGVYGGRLIGMDFRCEGVLRNR